MKSGIVLLTLVLALAVLAFADGCFNMTDGASLRALMEKQRAVAEDARDSYLLGLENKIVQFYGKLINTCDAAAGDNCFSAVVAGGRTSFVGEGGDLANIYVPYNDYDTWRQHSPIAIDSTHSVLPTEGEFVYQMRNVTESGRSTDDTISCLTLQLKWTFQPAQQGGGPTVGCDAVSLAANWDCHLDWVVSAKCQWNSDTMQVEAEYQVVNLGPEKEPDNPSVLSVVSTGDCEDGNQTPTYHLQQQRTHTR